MNEIERAARIAYHGRRIQAAEHEMTVWARTLTCVQVNSYSVEDKIRSLKIFIEGQIDRIFLLETADFENYPESD